MLELAPWLIGLALIALVWWSAMGAKARARAARAAIGAIPAPSKCTASAWPECTWARVRSTNERRGLGFQEVEGGVVLCGSVALTIG